MRIHLLGFLGFFLLGTGGAVFGASFITGHYAWAAVGALGEAAGGFTLGAAMRKGF